jgi:hypothetical protein
MCRQAEGVQAGWGDVSLRGRSSPPSPATNQLSTSAFLSVSAASFYSLYKQPASLSACAPLLFLFILKDFLTHLEKQGNGGFVWNIKGRRFCSFLRPASVLLSKTGRPRCPSVHEFIITVEKHFCAVVFEIQSQGSCAGLSRHSFNINYIYKYILKIAC